MAIDKLQQSDDQVILDNITASQFCLLVDLVEEWIPTGLVKVRFSPNARIEFDDNKILPLLEKRNLPQNCVSLIKLDISFMLTGILTGSRGTMINFLTRNASVKTQKGSKPPTKEQITAATTAHLNYVEQKLITSDLRKQYAIKDKAKTDTYYRTAWEVIRSLSENDSTVPVGLTYATLRIDTLNSSLTESANPFFMPSKPGEYESVVLTMTLQDLEDLIENLSNAAKAIKQSMDSEEK